MKNRVLLVLSFVFIFSMLLACSDQSSEQTDDNQTGDNEQQNNNSSDNNGNEEKELTLKWMLGDSAVQPVKVEAPAVDEILRLTNVNIDLEPVPDSNYEDKKSALIATNNIPDVISVSNKDIQDYARTGIFLPISDYMEHMPNFQKLIEDRPEVNKLKVDGKLYGFPVLEQFRVGVAPQPLIRMDLLEEHNLEVPTSFDELYEVLKALKQEYPDSIPFTGRNGTLYLLGQLAYPMGSGGFPGFSSSPMYFEPNEDQYRYGPIQENFKDVVTFLNTLYEEELLDPDYAVNTKDMAFEKLSSGRALFYYDNNTFAARIFNPALQENDPNARFELIAPLENADGEVRSYRYERDWLGKNYAISSQVEDPVAVAKFFDWMYSEEGTLVTNFGIEGEHYDMEDGNPVVKQSLLDEYANQQDIATAIRGEIGVGMLNIAVNVDEYWDTLVTDEYMVEMGEQINERTEQGLIDYMSYDPPFTEEEAESLKRIETSVNTMFEQEVDKFIMGVRPMSEYEQFVEELVDKGAEEIEEIYNNALARVNE